MDAGDLTDIMKRSIIFLLGVITSGEGGLRMNLRVMYLKEANVIVREEKGKGIWAVEKSSEEGTKVLKLLDKEPSICQLTKILQESFPSVNDFIFRIEG